MLRKHWYSNRNFYQWAYWTLVRYDDNAKISLLYISHLIGLLEKLLHRKVDLVEEGCLLPFAEETANRDKILIYERGN